MSTKNEYAKAYERIRHNLRPCLCGNDLPYLDIGVQETDENHKTHKRYTFRVMCDNCGIKSRPYLVSEMTINQTADIDLLLQNIVDEIWNKI